MDLQFLLRWFFEVEGGYTIGLLSCQPLQIAIYWHRINSKEKNYAKHTSKLWKKNSWSLQQLNLRQSVFILFYFLCFSFFFGLNLWFGVLTIYLIMQMCATRKQECLLCDSETDKHQKDIRPFPDNVARRLSNFYVMSIILMFQIIDDDTGYTGVRTIK